MNRDMKAFRDRFASLAETLLALENDLTARIEREALALEELEQAERFDAQGTEAQARLVETLQLGLKSASEALNASEDGLESFEALFDEL